MSYYKDQELIPENREARIRDTYIKCSRLEAENKELKDIIKELIEATEYGVNQWQKAYNPESETNAQKIIKKAKEYVTNSTQKDKVGAESNNETLNEKK